MSARTTTVGNTLAGGIQDVAALLPLIGTEQCETHVGSALKGGYLYAAATPLSIFGSLGIVKAGISILFSSVSVTIPKISVAFHNFRPMVVYSRQRQWLGAKILDDAGFKLCGAVAPLIGMDGQRFKAETRLLEILEEKHIDNPAKVVINWKSRHWNIMLIILTLLGAFLSVLPYIALLLGPTLWRPTRIHLPWLYPSLRIVASCFATVTSQFLIQHRVVSLMKSRILFMTVDQTLIQQHKVELESWQKDKGLEWDPNLPAEQCLQSLDRLLSTSWPLRQKHHDSQNIKEDLIWESDTTLQPTKSNTFEAKITSDPIFIPTTIQPKFDPDVEQALSSSSPDSCAEIIGGQFSSLCKEHFPTSTQDTVFILFLWTVLGISLPAMVAGYIGCFTLVSATPLQGNGPLIWVGLEAALSILRIVIWASNPSFDERTEISLGLKLTHYQPMVTTNEYNPHLTVLTQEEKKPFTLVPEHEFLEWITPFTGPLDQFQKADNINLYFTLTTDYGWSDISDIKMMGQNSIEDSEKQPEHQCLFMTVYDFNMQLGVTFLQSKGSFSYFDVIVKYDTISRKLEANIQSTKMDIQPWRIENNNLFDALKNYYQYIVRSLNQRDMTAEVHQEKDFGLLPALCVFRCL